MTPKALVVSAVMASCAVAQPPAPVTFGTTVVVSGGLRGVIYYIKPGSTRLPDFRALKPAGTIYTSMLDVPRQSFTRGFPGVTTRFEWFAIDYTGRFWIEKAGNYRFALTSDDGARLWIDNALVIDNDGAHPPREIAGDVELRHGIHRIRVAYFQGRRFEVALVLKVAPVGQDLRVFRTDDLKPPPGEWTEPRAPGDRVLIDNDFVRVVGTTLQPGQATPPREDALNRVIIYLDSGKIESHDRSGRPRKQHFSVGQAGWRAANAYTEQNLGDAPVREIEIELKKPGPVTPPVRARELDPVLIDPRHNKLLFENDQVRVFRSWREPGGVEPLHQHLGAGKVVVFLSDADATIQENGSISTLHARAGEVSWSGPVKHAATNTGAKKMEMMVVEVK